MKKPSYWRREEASRPISFGRRPETLNNAAQTGAPTEAQPRPSHGPGVSRLRAGLAKATPFALGVAAALVAMLVFRFAVPGQRVLSSSEVNQLITDNLASATPPPPFSEAVYSLIQPSLVLIKTQSASDEGLGSGTIINAQGQILTSLHVVSGANTIEVTFADGSTSSAEVVASRPENDIAVLQPASLPQQVVPAVLGNPNAMRVGDEAYAVGNPFGLYSSMSAGVISGFDRSFRPESTGQTLNGLIQIDAAVNPGNSGGPLLNRYGEVIGVVTGIANPTEEHVFIGIGFAVPITVAAGGGGSPPY
jgi:S1-C subfamily serine protease